MRLQRVFLGIGALLLLSGVLFGVGQARAKDPVQHGISFTKGCDSPTNIGQPYSCSFTIRNISDDAHDTLTANSLFDTVVSAGGSVTSGNIIRDGMLTTTLNPTSGAQTGSTCFEFVRGGADITVNSGSATATT